jgi:hypothetical protein
MITGRVIIASVNDAEIIEYPNPAAYTNAPSPKRACTMLGTPAGL